MHQYQSFAPQTQPTVAEYAFPSVLQFLQSEWRRFERDRNEWDIEKAEMKARIAFLEGEKRGVDNTKLDLMKRVKMLEYALRQERSKYVEGNTNAAPVKTTTPSAPSAGVTVETSEVRNEIAVNNTNNKALNRMSTFSASGQSMAQTSPTSITGLDLNGRARSREFLRICLQEISYLTSSVPQSIAQALPPSSNRLSRHESDKRPIGPNGIRGGARTRPTTEYYPAQPKSAAVVPPLPRSNSVPIATLQSMAGIKPNTSSPPLETEVDNMSNPSFDMNTEQQTLKHSSYPTRVDEPEIQTPAPVAQKANKDKRATEKMEQILATTQNGTENHVEEDEILEDPSVSAFREEEAVTVFHAPISEDLWHAQLQRAGQQLAQKPNGKKAHAEDEAQLSKDVQDKFNISPERLNKLVKDWDKAQADGAVSGQKSIRKKKVKDAAMLDELASLTASTADTEGASEAAEKDLGNEGPRWQLKATLKRHMDTVTSIAFHPTNKSILSGSEDGTMKYWNLESPLRESKRTLTAEIEPVHTYRGHTKAITSVAISADHNKCFSGSMDSTIRAWKMVPMNKETYSRHDPSLALSSFIGHTDSVWDLRLFPLSISSSQLLASISADGALKIWDTETKGSPLRSSWGYNGLETSALLEPAGPYTSGLTKLPTPTGLDFCSTDLKKMVVSYSNSVVKLFDIETGKEILAFKSDETYDGTSATQINKVVCHPTMPVMVSGHEDRYIRFFDINSGSCSFSMLSHLDAVSSLDIDPSGLVLCSGGHDGSVRLWDMASSSKTCLQEFTSHRRKGDEGVCAVQYHRSLPDVLATAGADLTIKIHTKV
ncbi:hypothetical protein BGZ59_007848 [Podila verticillata]|nr:hypothetical protein BGZ59_007848 [Podila verticillata]